MSELVPLSNLYEEAPDTAVYYAKVDFMAFDGGPREISRRYGIPHDVIMANVSSWKVEREGIEANKVYNAVKLQQEHLETVVARACELTLKALERAERLGVINSVADAEKLAGIAAKLHKPLQLIQEKPTDIVRGEQVTSIEAVLEELRALDNLNDYSEFGNEH